MKRRLLGGSLAAAMAISALGAPALAEPPQENLHNCLGVSASGAGSSQGRLVKGIVHGGPGAWAAFVHATLKPACREP
jgi:uncharacterized membrane protein